MPDLQTNKNKSKLVRMPSEPGGRTLFKLKLEEHILETIRSSLSGKVGLMTELIPLKNGKLVPSSEAQDLIGLMVHC